MTATTARPAEDVTADRSWLQLLKRSLAGEDGDVYVNVCACEAFQPSSLTAQRRRRQHTVVHRVQQTQTAVAAAGLRKC